MGPIRLAAVAVGVVVFGTCAVVALLGGPGAERSPLIGRVAPPIEGRTLRGEPVDLSDARGRWVLVNFFAPWCTQCIEEHPELERFASRHRPNDDARVVSVVVDTSRGDADAFIEQRQPDWPFVLDPDGGTRVAYGLLKVPESYLIAPTGIVAAKFEGALTADGIDRLIRELTR